MSTIVISGSVKRYEKEIEKFALNLKAKGFNVIYPKSELSENEWDKLSNEILRKIYKGLTLEYFDYIERADVVFIYNKEGYSGNSVTLEIGYAYAMKKKMYAFQEDDEICKDVLFDGYAKTPIELIRLIEITD